MQVREKISLHLEAAIRAVKGAWSLQLHGKTKPGGDAVLVYFTLPITTLTLINSDLDMFWAVMLSYPATLRTPARPPFVKAQNRWGTYGGYDCS